MMIFILRGYKSTEKNLENLNDKIEKMIEIEDVRVMSLMKDLKNKRN